MKSVFIGLLVLLSSEVAFSYGHYTGKVTEVRIDRDGRGIISFDGQIAHNPATCRTSPYFSHFSFDATTEGGKAIYSMAITAAATGKRVSAIGTGTCQDYNSLIESLRYWVFLSE